MVRFFLALFILGGLGQVYAQITNASFEHWQPVPGASGAEDPVGWTSNNIICDTVAGYAIRKSTVARSGNYALEIRPGCRNPVENYADLYLGEAQIDSIIGYLLDPRCSGTAVSVAPFIVSGYYQYYYPNGSAAGSAAIAATLLTEKCGGSWGASPPAAGSLLLTRTTSLIAEPQSAFYRPFAFPIALQTDSVPNLEHLKLQLFMSQTDTAFADGRYLLIDDLSLHGNLLTLPKQNLASLIELYPNPVSASLRLEKPDFLSVAKMAVYNTRGELVIKASSWQAQLDFSKLVPGLYLLQLETSAGLVTKRVMKS